jgi:hypothetical protein
MVHIAAGVNRERWGVVPLSQRLVAASKASHWALEELKFGFDV